MDEVATLDVSRLDPEIQEALLAARLDALRPLSPDERDPRPDPEEPEVTCVERRVCPECRAAFVRPHGSRRIHCGTTCRQRAWRANPKHACPRCGILMTLGECRFCTLELAGVRLTGALRD